MKKVANILSFDVIFEEAKEGGFTAYVPRLPGCISEGDTFEETNTNISEAISTYLESLAKDGEEIADDNHTFFIGKVEIPFSNLSIAQWVKFLLLNQRSY